MKMYHSWAGHAARLTKENLLHDLLRYRSLTNEGLRCVWGRPKDWNGRLKDHHGSEWWLLASDRETWKRCGGDFVRGRCEAFGVVEPDTRVKDSGPTWKAGFLNLLGNPVLGRARNSCQKQTMQKSGSLISDWTSCAKATARKQRKSSKKQGHRRHQAARHVLP